MNTGTTSNSRSKYRKNRYNYAYYNYAYASFLQGNNKLQVNDRDTCNETDENV